tara:strand:+ start:1102 stop:1971 length:870 start_codon:yes stop_codon:yes gene_type:complete
MIICKLQGGLGNQMFQYSFAKTLSNKLRREVKFDLSRLNDHTSIKGHTIRDLDLSVFDLYLDVIDNELPNWEVDQDFYFLKEPRYTQTIDHRNFFKNLDLKCVHKLNSGINSTIYIDGHWQKSQWTNPDFFNFKDKSRSALHNHIESTTNPTVCINVRRGDYLTNYKDFFYELTLDNYFYPAIEYMEKFTEGKAEYYVFSDDMEWCKENIRILDSKVTFVEHTEKGHKFSKYLEMMSKCDHFIIPNSSFAYWAATLQTNDNKLVISPRQWFKDPTINDHGLQPESWLRI